MYRGEDMETSRCPRCYGTFLRDWHGLTCLQCGYEPPQKPAGFVEPMPQATKVIKAKFADKEVIRVVGVYRVSKYS